jgi:ATP-dependent exoDNAse (exonuclease V) beta subunit
LHRLFEEVSKSITKEKDITERLRVMLAREGVTDGDLLETVVGDVLNLSRVGLLNEIVLPARNSYTELPFVLEKGDTIFKGRIDRVILKPDRADIYDYKTFPMR